MKDPRDRRSFLSAVARAGLGLGLCGFRSRAQEGGPLDLVLRGGRVLDGTGRPAFESDIGIRGDRIVAVGDLEDASAARSLDVSRLTVSPGFIDVHAHSEDELLENPKAESKVRQGVTTEILGQDGSSFAPEAFASELGELSSAGIALNVASFVGQGTIRGEVMGMSDRAATDDEIGRMQELARTALEGGALGLSSGLEYTPGGFASADEIAAVAKAMTTAGGGGLYATHMRNEDDRVLEAVEEAIRIAERAGVGLHISHLKCQGRRNWGKLDDVFAAIAAAESRGVRVTLDRYPYVAYSTGLSNLMPLWSREGGTEAFAARLRDPEVWPRIRRAMEDKIDLLGSWESVMISSVRLERNRPLQGKTIEQILSGRDDDPFEFVRDLVLEEDNRVGMVGFGMSEENTARILAHPRCMPASDGSALADYGSLRRGSPHPRSYGTFARVLGKYVREDSVLTLAEAVRKMTSLPAERFGIAGRGRIAEGFFADLAVFDPASVEDRATFADPHQYAAGFEYVVVNGTIVLDRGERPEALPGRVLRG